MSGSKSQSSGESESEGSGFNTGGNVSGGVNIGQGTSSGFTSGETTGSSSASSASQDRIYGAQDPFLRDKYQQSRDLYQQQQPQLAAEAGYAGDFTRGVQDTAMAGWQDQMAGAGPSQYADEMRGVVAQDAGRAQEQMLAQMDARAAASGMSGGARHGSAIGQGMTGINDAMLREQANIGFQAEEAARGRQMQALGMSPQMTAMGTAGFDPLNAQWSGMQNYNQIIGDPTKLTSNVSNQQSTQSSKNFGANQSLNQNLGFNFGLGQNYGENTNMSSAENDAWAMSGGIG